MKDAILALVSDEKLKADIPARYISGFRENLKKKLRERSKPFGCFYDFEQWVVRQSIKFKPKS